MSANNAEGLYEALEILNRVRQYAREDNPENEPAFYLATNTLIQEISFRENSTIEQVLNKIKSREINNEL